MLKRDAYIEAIEKNGGGGGGDGLYKLSLVELKELLQKIIAVRRASVSEDEPVDYIEVQEVDLLVIAA